MICIGGSPGRSRHAGYLAAAITCSGLPFRGARMATASSDGVSVPSPGVDGPCPLRQDIDPHANHRYLPRWDAFLRNECAGPDLERLRSRLEPRVQRFGYSLLNANPP